MYNFGFLPPTSEEAGFPGFLPIWWQLSSVILICDFPIISRIDWESSHVWQLFLFLFPWVSCSGLFAPLLGYWSFFSQFLEAICTLGDELFVWDINENIFFPVYHLYLDLFAVFLFCHEELCIFLNVVKFINLSFYDF